MSRHLTKVSFTDLTKRAHKVQRSAGRLHRQRRDPAKTLAVQNKAISNMIKGVTPEEAAAMISDGAVLMIGGFMGVGSPHRIIDAIVQRGVRNLTVIANDTARPDYGIGKLIRAGAVSRLIASHIGLNPETQKAMIDGVIQVELTPQGTLAEQIRAGGYGLGGVLTKTALGTIAAEGKKIIDIDGEQWLYAPPLRADFALIAADRCDHIGNVSYQLTATNFNPVMAMAAETVICEPREILPVGVIPPDSVNTPGVLVNYIIRRGAHQ
jgi:acetate CoA/acetoacetate CoA-transferase alpha subunit